MRRFFVLIVVMVMSASAFAQDEDPKARAAELFRQADQAADRREPAKAAELYAEAYRIAPHAITKYNEAFEWEKARERARAADAYEDALERDELDDSRRRDARLRLAALKKQLGYLRVVEPVGARVSVAHVSEAPAPTNVHLPPGSHSVRTELGNCRRVEQVTVRAGASHDLSVACAPEPKPVKPPPRPPPPRPSPTSGVRKPTSTLMRDAGWVVMALGIAGGMSLLPLAQTALDANERWKDSGLTDEAAHTRARDFRTATNVTLAISAGVAGIGLTLVLLAPN